jgi:Amt family ammonium transporter
MLLGWMISGKPSAIGACAGAVAGLVAITPASGFVEPMAAIAIGVGAGALCYLAVQLRTRTKLDDSLDVVAVHGVGGTWGAVATGIFAVGAVSGIEGYAGAVDGNASQILDQLAAIGVVWVYSFVATAVILKVLDLVMGLRVNEDEENVGLDVSQHGERAYVIEEAGTLPMAPQVSASSAPDAEAQSQRQVAPEAGGAAR